MKIQFVLVEPKVPENIGASARAIKTMGFNSLVLVNPANRDEVRSRWLAHGSGEILDNSIVCNTLDEAIIDSDYIVATTAKPRSVKHDYVPSVELADFIKSKAPSINNLSVVFGREESGLTNMEMKLCDITSRIAMARSYPSLNLSQAVMIYAYELSRIIFEDHTVQPEVNNENSIKALKVRIRKLLLNTGLAEDDNRFGRIMERVSLLASDDINLLHTVCNLITEKIKD
jgi:tRNA/rRNA methyltransferase